MDFLSRLDRYAKDGKISEGMADNLHLFYHSYHEAVRENLGDGDSYQHVLLHFLEFIVEQLQNP